MSTYTLEEATAAGWSVVHSQDEVTETVPAPAGDSTSLSATKTTVVQEPQVRLEKFVVEPTPRSIDAVGRDLEHALLDAFQTDAAA